MLNLHDIPAGGTCLIAWLTGRAGAILRKYYKIAEDKPIRVIRNMGRGGVIVRMDGRSFALSADAAQSVKVSLL